MVLFIIGLVSPTHGVGCWREIVQPHYRVSWDIVGTGTWSSCNTHLLASCIICSSGSHSVIGLEQPWQWHLSSSLQSNFHREYKVASSLFAPFHQIRQLLVIMPPKEVSMTWLEGIGMWICVLLVVVMGKLTDSTTPYPAYLVPPRRKRSASIFLLEVSLWTLCSFPPWSRVSWWN
jgi:hypothetical protein